MHRGIDVSFWNGLHIDWKKVKEAGYDFAYIKASEGASRIEPNALTQDVEAVQAGLQVGYYHFAHLGEHTAQAEADLFERALQFGAYTLVPVVDVETNKNNLSPAQFTKWLSDFIKAMKAKGNKRIMIYGGTWMLNNSLLPDPAIAECPLWLADYESKAHVPKGWTNYTVWQHSDKGHIPGINGQFDVNVCPDLTPILITA